MKLHQSQMSFIRNKKILYYLFLLLITNTSFGQFSIAGKVTKLLIPEAGARVTLYNKDTTFFEEERTDATGGYMFSNILPGKYTIGISKLNYAYKDSVITLNTSLNNINFSLLPETEKGSWDIIVQSPEKLGGTDLGILMPDGKIYYCHDTKDPFYFDPLANDTIAVPGSMKVQGCVGPLLLDDEKVWFFGGTLKEVYGPGTQKVKTYDPKTEVWKDQNNMLDFRWYPTVSPLANGKVLIAGGGGLNNPIRVKTSEVYDPKTGISIMVDNLAIGNEVSPIVPLLTGKTLMTHRPPQLFDPSTNQWELAADFVQSNRMSNGDHSDHELVVMPDGNVVAIGYKNFNGILGTFVELYDPIANKWTLKSSIAPVRSRAKAVILPDKKILVAGGYKEDPTNHTPVNQWNYMKRADLYNLATDSWKQADDMNYFREYHAITTLVPDGRVIAVGGEGEPGNEPPLSIIEAYYPPYLFRGIRPEISKISKTSYARGGKLNFSVSKTDSITGVQLMSCAVNTHFMNSSHNRFLELKFTQEKGLVNAELPLDSVLFPPGFYMLFVMVDDIPSIAQIIKALDTIIIINTGIVEADFKLDVYPIPFTTGVSIQSAIPIQHLKLIDISGRPILFQNVQKESYLNLKNLAEGIYFLEIYFDNGQSTLKKLIKIRQ
ncbi:MAG: DUF1929 domain-containing protein [Bacteroidota bacterium]|nr:DUF1929 domain-containing protein [Bacteroidota bacterium]